MIVKFRNTVVGAGLWAVALSASALSLGAGRGSVVLGSSIDLTFDIEPDPGVELSASCLAAGVTVGSTPVGESRVRLTPLPDLRGRSPAVRLQVPLAVDEPMVTVVLSAGCSGRVSRTYTFLADMPAAAPVRGPVDVQRLPGAGALPAGAATGGMPEPASAAPPSAAVPGRPAGTAPQAAPAAVAPVQVPAASPSPARARPAPPRNSPPKVAPKTDAAPRPRLVMEPLELWLDSPVALRASTALATVPAEGASPERERALAQWQALNTPLEVQVDREQRLSALDAELRQAKAQLATERSAASQRQAEMGQALEERFPAEWVYGLGALALLLAGGVVGLALRLRRTGDGESLLAWKRHVAHTTLGETGAQPLDLSPSVPPGGDAWNRSDTLPVRATENDALSSLPDPVPGATPLEGTLPAGLAAAMAPGDSVSPPAAPPPAMPAFFERAAPSVPSPAKAPAVVAAAPAAAEPAVAQASSVLHIINAEELFDIQQQAEFFVSVGEHSHAIEILQSHIAEHATTSPLAYIELLRLFHTLGRADDFERLRAQFVAHFNVRVPDFSAFHRAGKTLEQYPDALATIEAEWTLAQVVERLEGYLFRQKGGQDGLVFDMAAFDDLLMLLAIAQTTPPTARGAPPPRQRTTPQPQSFEQAAAAAIAASAVAPLAPTPDLAMDSLSAGLDFDLDLSAPSAGAPLALQPVAPDPAPVVGDTLDFSLDLDLTDPPPLTLSEVPPVPASAPPAPGQVVGFGSSNDMLEVRFELDPRPGDDGKP